MASGAEGAFSVLAIDPSCSEIRVEELPRRTLGAALTARVAELFAQECRERAERGLGQELYDGSLFSLIENPGTTLRGCFVGYSEWVAQLRAPELRDELGIRPLGVTGAIVCDGSLWLGKRSKRTYLLPGAWELCPSGGVDLDARGDGGRIEPERQLRAELEEELAWPASRVRSALPFAFVEDRELAVVDLVYRLELDATGDELERAVNARENREYERIQAVPLGQLAEFVRQNAQTVSPVAIAMLEAGGWLARA